jgi:UDP-N-acetylglucosamine 3-dehydrogenase
MIKVGVVGAGFAGSFHARAYAKVPGVEVAVIADQNGSKAAALAAEVGARAETDVEAILLDPSVDIVDVALPTPLHPQYAIRAFEAGKHVVIEKPLALSVNEADAIIDAAQASGKFLMVAHVLRFWPEYIAIRKVLQSGRLGQPRIATAYRLSNLPQWATWFRDPAMTGGSVLDLHIHDLDMVNWLFGQPRRVRAIGAKGETGGWDHVITQVEFDTLNASVEASNLMPLDFPFTAGLRVVCDQGVIEYQFRAGGASFESGQPVHYCTIHEAKQPNQPVEFESGDAFEREIAYFVSCVERRTPPEIVTPEDARLAVQTALAARQSLETGESVVLNSVEE